MGIHYYGAEGRCWMFGLALAFSACNGQGNDGDDSSASSPEEQRCESAEIELTNSCFFPNGNVVVDDDQPERPSVTDIAAAAEALDGGFYLEKIAPSDATDQLGFVLEDNEVCRVSCLTQCDITIHSLCVTSLALAVDGSPRGCLFCGEATREQCQAFVDACE
jgi:hypothetical protein